MAVLHGTWFGDTPCEVEFLSSRNASKQSDILRGYTCSWHDNDTVSSLLDELSNYFCTLDCGGLTPRGEYTSTASFDDIFKSSGGITTDINSSVEGHG